jgi:hypothetical protein
MRTLADCSTSVTVNFEYGKDSSGLLRMVQAGHGMPSWDRPH